MNTPRLQRSRFRESARRVPDRSRADPRQIPDPGRIPRVRATVRTRAHGRKRTTQAKRQKSHAGSELRFHNPQGAEVTTRDEAFASSQDVSVEAVPTSAKLELHNGAITFAIEVKCNPHTYPHVVTGGQITSGICGAPWEITPPRGDTSHRPRPGPARAGSTPFP
ncbi:hypothetical protein ACFVXV_24430, partial [Streptomyces sp. NPDC058272]